MLFLSRSFRALADFLFSLSSLSLSFLFTFLNRGEKGGICYSFLFAQHADWNIAPYGASYCILLLFHSNGQCSYPRRMLPQLPPTHYIYRFGIEPAESLCFIVKQSTFWESNVRKNKNEKEKSKAKQKEKHIKARVRAYIHKAFYVPFMFVLFSCSSFLTFALPLTCATVTTGRSTVSSRPAVVAKRKNSPIMRT